MREKYILQVEKPYFIHFKLFLHLEEAIKTDESCFPLLGTGPEWMKKKVSPSGETFLL
jgi:hypothetical protein